VVLIIDSIILSSANIAGHLGQTIARIGVPPNIANLLEVLFVFPMTGKTLEKAVATVVVVTAAIKFLLLKSLNFISSLFKGNK
jgi:hypothetical protein